MPQQPPKVDLDQLLADLEAMDEHRRYNRWEFFEPYDKQRDFYTMGLTLRERLLSAGNQQGKTEAGAFEFTMHLTGLYPWWWQGMRWKRPIRAWCAGETGVLVRDVAQAKLCGAAGVEEAFGTGFIPRANFVEKPSLSRGVTDAYDTMQIRHVSGGISTCTFKSYEQGRTKFQGEPVDLIWLDEEPPMDIYSECLTRTTATKGKIMITFTPVNGRTNLYIRFHDNADATRAMITMTIYDAKHILPEERDGIITAYPEHEREARAMGTPMMGEGRVFPYPDSMVAETGLLKELMPMHWTKLWSIDFGIGHPFGATLQVWDRDSDVIHVVEAFKIAGQIPLMHAARMKPIGVQIPVAWPHDGTQRQADGAQLQAHYKRAGLVMLDKWGTFPEGGYSTEAGVLEMDERIQTGRLKVAAHLTDWFEEYRSYHRKDGQIVKTGDDIMSATRIGVMMKRKGRVVPFGGKPRDKTRQGPLAKGVDFDLF